MIHTRFNSSRGAALLDLLAATALMITITAMALPLAQGGRERDSARLAAKYLAQRLQLLRVEAVRRNRHVALRFDPEDPALTRAFQDTDGDGVLQRDIDRGVDTPLAAATRLSDTFALVRMAIRADVPSPDLNGTMTAGSDPVRTGGSDLLSFSPLGTATSATIYLTGDAGPQWCVRVLGSTGRIRVLWFDVTSSTWRTD